MSSARPREKGATCTRMPGRSTNSARFSANRGLLRFASIFRRNGFRRNGQNAEHIPRSAVHHYSIYSTSTAVRL